jgi:hypothetical protein
VSTDPGVHPFPARSAPFGTTGGTRYRDGRVQDRWGRSEEQVRAQRKLADEIAKCLDTCRERAPEIEFSKSFGPKNLRRLEVAAGAFRRLVERDGKVLLEFEAAREADRLSRASAAAVVGELHRRATGQNGAAA